MPQAPFKPGDRVQQVLPPPIKGVILGYALDQTNGRVSYHVGWKTPGAADGEDQIHTHYFDDDQIEAVPEDEPELKAVEKKGVTP